MVLPRIFPRIFSRISARMHPKSLAEILHGNPSATLAVISKGISLRTYKEIFSWIFFTGSPQKIYLETP